jgi:hypothetical protein
LEVKGVLFGNQRDIFHFIQCEYDKTARISL